MILDKLKAKFHAKDVRKLAEPLLSMTIEQLDLTVRTYHILKRQGMNDVGDLVKLSWKDLAGIRRGNRRLCEEVERVLDGMGLGLRKDN